MIAIKAIDGKTYRVSHNDRDPFTIMDMCKLILGFVGGKALVYNPIDLFWSHSDGLATL